MSDLNKCSYSKVSKVVLPIATCLLLIGLNIFPRAFEITKMPDIKAIYNNMLPYTVNKIKKYSNA